MKKLAIVLVLGMSLLPIQSMSFAQKSEAPTGPTVNEQDIELLRSDIRSTKKQIIGDNMKLTGAQAEQFWPVYDAYAQETTKLGDSSLRSDQGIREQLRGYDGRSSREPRHKNGNVGRANRDPAPAVDSEIREGPYRKTECVVLPIGPARGFYCSICSLPQTFRLSSSVRRPHKANCVMGWSHQGCIGIIH